jgi:hypothetical protein
MNSTSLGDNAASQAARDALFTTDYLPLSLPHLGYLSLLHLPFHSATLAFAPSSPSRLPHLRAFLTSTQSPPFPPFFHLSLLRLPRARAIPAFLDFRLSPFAFAPSLLHSFAPSRQLLSCTSKIPAIRTSVEDLGYLRSVT